MTIAVRDNPDYWNAYDSLGEMYARAGDKQLAIQNYRKSLQLNPTSQTGLEALKMLGASSDGD
jgi:Flp pilus assembly protein TadD